MTVQNATQISFVIPVFNEEDVLPELIHRLEMVIEKLDGPVEVIFVNDGSKDRSVELMADKIAHDPRFKLVSLSRNFGHQIAVTAGLDAAAGSAVIVMDADLQDPPELALDMIDRWKEGYEVVFAVREERDGESVVMSGLRRLFYRLLSGFAELDIPVDAGDFRLMDRRAMDAYLKLRENNRYIRGLTSWIGSRQSEITYKRPARFAGESKYNLFRLVKLGVSGFLGFSRAPLRFVIYVGFIMAFFAALGVIWVFIHKLMHPEIIEGWPTTVILISFIGGIQLIALGIIAEYIGCIYDEVKMRPIYVVSEYIGFQDNIPNHPRMVFCPSQNMRDGSS